MLKYKKIDPNLPDLIRGSAASAGIDLYTTIGIYVPTYGAVTIPTGVAVEIPDGYFGLIAVRSSLGFKSDLTTHIGIIDADYRGEIFVRARLGNKARGIVLEKYSRVAQLIILPCSTLTPVEVESLSDTERGEGGLGSTGT